MLQIAIIRTSTPMPLRKYYLTLNVLNFSAQFSTARRKEVFVQFLISTLSNATWRDPSSTQHNRGPIFQVVGKTKVSMLRET